MKFRVLVFPCGSEIGLEIHNSLKWSTHVDLFGASSVDDHGQYVYKNYIGALPYVSSDLFIHVLNVLITQNKIDFIYPAHDSVLVKLAEESHLVKCKVIGSPPQTCLICRSKSKTYSVFQSIIRVPEQYCNIDGRMNYPVFLKPDIGQGSKGTHIAESSDELNYFITHDPTLLILEYLPGKEYTVDCFTDRKGKLLFIGGRERCRISNGISVNTRPTIDSRFRELGEIINSQIELRGAWFFQLKESKTGDLCLLEIAPRIAGSMGMYRNIGVNFALLSIFDANGYDLSINTNNCNIQMDRALCNKFTIDVYYDHVYIDFDDTIVVDNSVNGMVVSFLFQCFNNGKHIHLLTRHEYTHNEPIIDALHRFRLANLFDSITSIGKNDPKSLFIGQCNSIFIDDSFSERKEVSEALGIPTFDSTSVECLLDWRY